MTYRKFFLTGDTIINSLTYKKVKYYNYTGGNPNQAPGPLLFAFAYRNDAANKKVYYLSVPLASSVEQLWYDFNLNVGDTLKNTYAFTNPVGYNSNPRRIVSSIDSVAFCGIYYKRFNFNCAWGSGLSLIEGVGFEDNFMQTGFGDCPFEPHTIYTTVFSTCEFVGIKDLAENKRSLQLYPNPTNSEIKLAGDFKILNYIIFSNVGDVIERGNFFGKTSIDVSGISNGLYILKVEDEKGNPFCSKFIKE